MNCHELSGEIDQTVESPDQTASAGFRAEKMPYREGRAAALNPEGPQVRFPVPRLNEMRETDFTVEAFVLLRSLYDDGSRKAQDVTRDDVLKLDGRAGEAPLLTVYGGKITTYRRLAEQAIDRLAHLIDIGPAWTGNSHLPGGELIEFYLEELAEGLSGAVAEARERKMPATIVYGAGRCNLATNRDFYDSTCGHYFCGFNQDGVADDTVVVGRVTKGRGDTFYNDAPITAVAGKYAAPRVFGMAGVTPEYIHLTGSYDAFTFTTMLQLEDYGFCKKGEGGEYVSSGIIELGGKRPNNINGGHLCEGYTHGMNMVIENTRQLRGQADDYCPQWQEGIHTYDYSEGKCRQVRDAEISMNLGWANPVTGSALIMRR